MDPNLWGPPAWYFLHTLTYTYPKNPTKEDQEAIVSFFESLRHLLPCTVCRTNYEDHFAALPIREHSHSRETMIKWLIDIHNEVNKETGKPSVSYESILNTRPPQYASNEINAVRIICLCLLILLIRRVKFL